MPIKNYTTTVTTDKTLGEIQKLLVAHGARSIMIDYNTDHLPCSLSFLISTAKGNIPFELPANIEAVEKLLWNQRDKHYREYDRRYQESLRQRLHDQAYRVGWRIIKDWIDAQCAIIATGMVTLEEVFLPYMQIGSGSDKKRFFLAVVDHGFYLPEGENEI